MDKYQEENSRMDAILDNDYLGQSDLLAILTRLIVGGARNNSASMGFGNILIDAPSPQGKSAFVASLTHVINGRYLNNSDSMMGKILDDEEKKILHAMSAFSFDAYELDVLGLGEYDILLEMISSVSRELGFSVPGSQIEKTAQDVGALLGRIKDKAYVPEVLKSPLHSVNLYGDILTGRNIKSKLNQAVDEIAKLNDYPLFVVTIDNIDKCPPVRALRLLGFSELFSRNPNLLFVFAGDYRILKQNIQTFYGNGFLVEKFLKRQFDFFCRLKEPPLPGYCRFILEQFGIEDKDMVLVISSIGDYYSFDLDGIHSLARQLALVWVDLNGPDGPESEETFFRRFFLAMTLGLKNKDRELLRDFLLGIWPPEQIVAIFENSPEILSQVKRGCLQKELTDTVVLELVREWYWDFLAALDKVGLYDHFPGGANEKDLAVLVEKLRTMETKGFEGIRWGSVLGILHFD